MNGEITFKRCARHASVAAFAAAILIPTLSLQTISNAADAPPVATLRQAAHGHPLIGAAVMSRSLQQPAFADLVAAQFDCLTSENELKPLDTEPSPGQFQFAGGDSLLAFAQAHGMKLIGHNLCWHNQVPGWMFKGTDGKPLPREQGLANLKRHIDGVAGHYKGKVLGWDVVNEAISDAPGEYLRNTPAKLSIGDDYVVQAFKFAQAADPDAELYYNDYSTENEPKRGKQIRLIKELKAAGCRIDAVGVQGHFNIKNSNSPTVLEEAIQAFAAEGVKVSISELDLDMLPRKTAGADVTDTEQADKNKDPYPNGLPADLEAKQADFYRRMFDVIERHKDVIERVTFWGVQDGASWLNNWPVKGRTNYPLLFDRNLQPKPAFDAVLKSIQNGGQ